MFIGMILLIPTVILFLFLGLKVELFIIFLQGVAPIMLFGFCLAHILIESFQLSRRPNKFIGLLLFGFVMIFMSFASLEFELRLYYLILFIFGLFVIGSGYFIETRKITGSNTFVVLITITFLIITYSFIQYSLYFILLSIGAPFQGIYLVDNHSLNYLLLISIIPPIILNESQSDDEKIFTNYFPSLKYLRKR